MRYELTERGKIIIAIVLVLLLFVLPSAYFAVKAWLGSPAPTPENPPQAMEPAPGTTEDEPPTTDGPLPNGSGSYPPDDPPQNGNGESAQPGNGDDDPIYTPEFGFVSVNTAAGSLIFLYAPELQNALDHETEQKVEQFLSSPRNTPDSQILVEMPQLPGGDLDILISAISHTFASYEVLQERLAYITYNIEPDMRSFEVRLSFSQILQPK